MREVTNHERSVRAIVHVALASGVLNNFPSASITQWMHANHEPIILLFYCNIDLMSSNFSFSKPIEGSQMLQVKII